LKKEIQKQFLSNEISKEEMMKLIHQNYKKTHICGKIWCSACNDQVSLENHQCYIGVLNEKEKQKYRPTNKIIFYDYETYCDKITNEHIPNLVVAYRCDANDINVYTEHMFSVYQPEYETKSVNTRFCEWLFSNENKGYTCMAHNSKGYDIHFIKQYLYNNDVPIQFSTIDTGSKSMTLKVKALRMCFIDSLNFFGSSLKELPKTYGLEAIKKGDFPHFFNQPENYNFIGPYPKKVYYGYGSMKESTATEFDSWYSTLGDKQFNFKEEIIEYCKTDVKVLMNAWIKFRSIFLAITKELSVKKFGDENTCIDPTKFITLASLCNAIYRCFFMPEKSIAILKENHTNYSVSELEWLLYEETERNIAIERQVKIGTYDVDGLHPQSKTVFEFNGCYFHGCVQCYNRQIVNKQNMKTMDTIYNQWITKKSYLESEGYTIVEMWSHTWTQLKTDKDIKKFLSENKHRCIAPNCSIRDSFFGGRTEVFDLMARSTDDMKIGYADFTSLYPSVQAIESFPIGHPTRIREFQNMNIDDFYGFVYCKIKSNDNLRIPVLAEKGDGKLIFSHGVKIGVWNSEELKLAVKMGYEILEIYEVIHFNERSNDLFSDYIRVFFKIKAECSFKGNPAKSGAEQSEADKDAYIADLNSGRFPVQLDKSKLAFNEGFRQVSKLCLNTLWGKFGQRNNMLQTLIIKDDIDMFNRIMFDDKIDVATVNFLNDSTVEVKYKFITDFVESSKNTNIAIASFTTAYARTWLYGAMTQVGFDNMIYCDTDSIIYYHPTEKNTIQTDSKLGGMTDELDGDFIQEIIALAPKTYTYIKSSGKVELKAKGFSINCSSTQQGLNFDTLKTIIGQVANGENNKNLDKKEISYPSRIRLSATSKRIFSKNETKTFQYTFNKRIVDYENSNENRLTTRPIIVQ
jgi:very-short-patch-repair endonuclease